MVEMVPVIESCVENGGAAVASCSGHAGPAGGDRGGRGRSVGGVSGGVLVAVFACVVALLGSAGSVAAVDPAPVQVISGVSGSLGSLAISADGAWRVAVERNASNQIAAVWRSSNATTWTRIVTPAGVTAGAVAILTNGNVVLAHSRARVVGLMTLRAGRLV